MPFDWRLTVGSLVLGPGQLLIIFVAAPVCILALTWYLNRSPLGKASRAAAENADAAQLAGVPIGRVSFNIWAIAGLLAGIGAILAGAHPAAHAVRRARPGAAAAGARRGR